MPATLADIDPSLRAATAKLGTMPVMPETMLRIMPLVMRFGRGTRTAGVERSSARRGHVRLRIHRPTKPNGAALLWLHGGGLITGSAVEEDAFCGATAHQTGITVIAASYRLSPGTRFPGPLDDCRDAWRWLRSQSRQFDLDPDRIAVGGQSAGGGLAAALAQQLTDAGDPPAAQWLFCPMLDDRTAADRSLDGQHLVWDNAANRVGWRAYLGSWFGASRLPAYAAAARRADLSGLPPAWIYASNLELFYPEDRDYAERLDAAGVDTTFVTVTGAAHGFENWAAADPKAVELTTSARSWLQQRLR